MVTCMDVNSPLAIIVNDANITYNMVGGIPTKVLI